MDNEINLFDMLLAKKLGGGGSVSPVVFTATQWSELPPLGLDKYFPTNIDPNEVYAIGKLSFSLSGMTTRIPVLVNAFEIAGGSVTGSGVGATVNLSYDDINEVWSVKSAWTNAFGSWTDITSTVQAGASDIKLTLYK